MDKEIGKLQKALTMRNMAQERVQNELNRIMVDNTVLLGPDGNPLQSGQDRIAQSVLEVIKKYLKAPTMTEQDLIPGLGQNTIEGASISLMSLLALTVFEPAKQSAPSVAPVIPHVFMHMLGYARTNSPIKPEGFAGLVDELVQHINLTARDENGIELVMTEDIKAMKVQVCQELLMALLSQSVAMEFLTMTDEEVVLTPMGDRLFRHMISVNQWIQNLQEEAGQASSLISQ